MLHIASRYLLLLKLENSVIMIYYIIIYFAIYII